jgi:flavin-dependent dehydrogenase
MESTDLAIVGASFAGLACAQAAAARGVRTLVLERKAEPGAACHTTGILVKEVADIWDVPRRLTRKIHGVRLYGPSLRWVDLASPGYYFLATDTPELLRWMAAQAEDAGASIRCAHAYQGASRTSSGFLLASQNTTCRYLVGCDGARSRVAQDFRLGRNRQFLVGAEIEMAGVEGVDDDRLHVLIDSTLAPGYIAWVVPGVGVTQVGLAARQLVAGQLDRLLERFSQVFDYSRAKVVARRGGLIPCGGPLRRWAGDGVMLLGDAAGMVSPLTAGGIHPAVQIGRAAGIALADFLLDNGYEPSRVVRAVAPSFACKRALRLAFDLGPPNWLVDRLLASRLARRLAQAVFFHHRGLFSLDAWRDIVLAVR